MNDKIEYLQKYLNNNPDLVIKKIKINKLSHIFVVFLESICSSDKINEYILKKLVNIKNINKISPETFGSKEEKIQDFDEFIKYLYNGYTLIYTNKLCFAIETKAEITRGLSTNENEPSIKGPKNAFVENYQTNLGLITKRLSTSNLKCQNLNIGRLSNTNIGILYLENVTKKENLNKVYEILKKIDIDILNSVEGLIKYLSNEKALFPTVISTERPDRCAKSLTEGKIVIIADNSPTALILPGFLIDFINPFSDSYGSTYNINFTKFIRLLCFFSSAIVPAFFISIINYNQEAIPTSLIINFASQYSLIPFPALTECLIMLIICEILKESDLRFPSKYGSATSILGALVLGDAAVSAGLVSPIMIIITSFTYISALVFTEQEISNALRYYRFFLLFLSAFLGLYGLMIGFIFMIISLANITSLDYPYSFPIAPFDKSYFNEVIMRGKNIFRSKKLTNNITKEATK